MSSNHMPRHVAIVMDGNGRWARRKLFPRTFGHRAGIKSVYHTIEYAVEKKIERLTLFAFGRENWCRPKKEVDILMRIFSDALINHMLMLKDSDVCLSIIGDRSRLSDKVLANVEFVESETSLNEGLQLNIAIDYSGRWEIIEAVKNITKDVKNGTLKINNISEDLFRNYLQKSISHPVDLLIRTSGEQRISNFMSWQIAYAELYFCIKMWPDFRKEDFQAAINNFLKRKRRFGRIEND